MKFDTRHWNLFAGALLAAAACGGSAPAEEDDSDSWDDSYCGGWGRFASIRSTMAMAINAGIARAARASTAGAWRALYAVLARATARLRDELKLE